MMSMKQLHEQVELMPEGPGKERAQGKLQELKEARASVARVKKQVRKRKDQPQC
jgi:hypothetical protein